MSQTTEEIREAVNAEVERERATYAPEPDHEPDSKRTGFHFLSANEICAEQAPTAWLVKGYLDAGSSSMIFGESGSMKSFTGLDLGLCIATKIDWHGNDIRQTGPVFFIAGEGFAGLNRRIKAWMIHHAVELRNVPFFVSDRPAQFLAPESVKQVIQSVDGLCEVHGNPVLVIIDTLNRNFGPGDENSTADMTRFISTIDEALRTRYHCAIQIIHHSGLSATERARGASALRASLDWEYRLQKNGNGTRILTCTKAKDHTEPPTLYFMPETITLDGWIDPEDGETMTSCILRRVEGTLASKRPLSGAKKIAFDALNLIDEEFVHIDTWRDAAYAAGVSPTSLQESKQKAFKRAVSALRDAGLVETRNDYWWTKKTPDMPDMPDI